MNLFKMYREGWTPEGMGYRKGDYIILTPRKNYKETLFQLRKVKSPTGVQISLHEGSFETLKKAMKAGNKAIRKSWKRSPTR